MKILIEQGGPSFCNIGDLAMLQIAVMRIQQLFPNASIQIFTTSPEKLKEWFPSTYPLSPSGSHLWLSPLVGQVHELMPNDWSKHLWEEIEHYLRKNFPTLVRSYLNTKLRMKLPEHLDQFDTYMNAIHEADLFIASGGGYITDVFKRHATSVISTLELAIKLNKPTVLLGQGLGPFRDPELVNRLKSTLPMVDLIALREKRVGLDFLKSIKVPPERVIVTGDDAIELAYNARQHQTGNGIGINLRMAKYSSIDIGVFPAIREVLHKVVNLYDAKILPVPISSYSNGQDLSDNMAIQNLLEDFDLTLNDEHTLNTPLKVIRQIGRCRVVVTGSYHAGVFALSQGIPVISLVRSEYYADKFLGLADQFKVGCKVIYLDDLKFAKKLLTAIQDFWQACEKLRPILLNSTTQQIEASKLVYQKIFSLV